MKHTPAPWKMSDLTDGNHYVVDTGKDEVILLERSDDENQDQEDLGNAYLIAAAPEMREVLDLLIKDNKLMNAMSREQVQALVNVYRKINGEK